MPTFDVSYKDMLSQHVENIFKKYTEPGLHVCDLATGGGKSHAIAKLTCQYYHEHFKRIVILCVQNKLVDGMVKEINDRLADSRTSLSGNKALEAKDILIVKSNIDVIVDAVKGGHLKTLLDEMKSKMREMENNEHSHAMRLKNVFESIETLAEMVDFAAQPVIRFGEKASDAYKKDLEEKERKLRSEIRRFFNTYKKCVERENCIKLKDMALLKEFSTLGKVFPQAEIAKKQVLVMTIQKAIHGIDPIIKDKMWLEDLVDKGEGNTLFILDESDQASTDIRNTTIQQQINTPFGQNKYTKGYQGFLTYNKLVNDRDNINNEKNTTLLKENLEKAATQLQENWQKEFGLDKGFNDILIANDSELEKFKQAVFFAGPTISLSIAPRGNKTNTYICYKEGDNHFSLVHRKFGEEKNLSNEYSKVFSLEKFLTFNLKNLNVIMRQLADVTRKSFDVHKKEFIEDLQRNDNNQVTEEVASSYLSFPTIEGEAYSVFSRFGDESHTQMQKYQLLDYMTNRKNIAVKDKNDKAIKVPDDAVYVQGIQLFEEDVDEMDNQRHIRISCREIRTTPEKILYNLVATKKASVVLCSATASGKSVINNCDIQYLRGRLGSDMHFLTTDEKQEFDRLVELTYPKGHNVEPVRIQQFNYDSSLPEFRMLPERYLKLFCKEAQEDGSAEDWYAELIADGIKGYEIDRWMQFVEVYHWFIHKDEIRSMIFFQNKKASHDYEQFHKVARMIDGTYKQDIHDANNKKISPYIEITNKAEDLEERILPKLSGDKNAKVMLVCAYGSFKAGVNMQYQIPEGLENCIRGDNWETDKKKHKKDWDAIYVQTPTNYMSIDTSQEKTFEEGLYKTMLNLMMLHARSCLSLSQVQTLMSIAMSKQKFMFSTDTYKGTINDKAAWALTILEQAIGRLCRTRNKPSTTYILYDEGIAPYFRKMDKNKSQTKEFRSLVKAVISANQEQEDLFDIDELIRYNKADNANRALENTRHNALRYTVKPKEREVAVPKDGVLPFKVESGQYVMANYKHTILVRPEIDDIAELTDDDRITTFIDDCFGDWKKRQDGSYEFKMSKEGNMWKLDVNGTAMVVSPETVRLNVLMKNDVIRQYFEDHGYATTWGKKKLCLHPEILMYDYAGEIGEEGFMALIQKYVDLGDKTIEHLDGFDYELADFVVKDSDGKNIVAFDVKNMNPEALHLDRHGDLPTVEKIKAKEQRLKCKVILVNMLKLNKHGMNDSREILGMIDENGIVQHEAIFNIRKRING